MVLLGWALASASIALGIVLLGYEGEPWPSSVMVLLTALFDAAAPPALVLSIKFACVGFSP